MSPSSPDVIVLTEPQRRELRRLLRAGRTAQRLVLRVRIVLLAAEARSNEAIASLVGCCVDTVRKWRHRWAAEPGTAADNAAIGTLYLAYRLPTLAEPCFARAAAIEPADVEHRYLLGVARFEEGRFEPALADFEWVLARRPRETAVMLYRAESLRRLGRLAEAQREVDDAVRGGATAPRTPTPGH